MGTYKLRKEDYIRKIINDEEDDLIKKEIWDKFNSTILGLGDLSEESIVISAISAIFDLEGFTNFCKQIDPQLSTPILLNQFLNWFFQKIKDETKNTEQPEGIQTWHDLPILTKFLGDGILVIWNTEGIDSVAQSNIIVSCKQICEKYKTEFYPLIKRKVVEAPKILRCGVAKGNIFSVGNGSDYVGPCINFSSRLQKLPGINFAFSDRGFNVEENWDKTDLDIWIIKKVNVRGIGDSELVYLPKADFNKLTPDELKYFDEP